jgi:hypothetical protein
MVNHIIADPNTCETKQYLGNDGAFVTVAHGSGDPVFDRFWPPCLVGRPPLRHGRPKTGMWTHPRKQGGPNRSKNGSPEPRTTVTKAPAMPTNTQNELPVSIHVSKLRPPWLAAL